MVRSKKLLTLLSALALLLAAVALSACGSGGGSSSSSETTTTATTEESGTDENNTEEASAEEEGGADPTKEYAPGVPTLEELYEGNDEPLPTEAPKPAKDVSVVWVSCGQESPGCASPAEAGEEAANKLGWTYHIVDEKLGVDNGNQRAVHEAIALSPDVLVMYGTNCPEVEQPLKEAKAAGIIVMGVGSLDCNAKGLSGEDVYEQEMQWTKQNPDNERFFEQWGENEAAYAVDASEGKGKIIELSYVGVFGKLLNEGKERILDKCAECEVVDNIEFTAEEQAPNGPIYQKFKTALVQHPEATVVLSSFNTPYTVSGVSKAILDAGRSDLIVVGAEGDGPSNEVIEQEKGITAVAAAYSTSQAAWATMDEINRFMNKEPLVPEGIGFIALAKGHNLPPNGEYYEGAVPYQQEYEKLWNAK